MMGSARVTASSHAWLIQSSANIGEEAVVLSKGQSNWSEFSRKTRMLTATVCLRMPIVNLDSFINSLYHAYLCHGYMRIERLAGRRHSLVLASERLQPKSVVYMHLFGGAS